MRQPEGGTRIIRVVSDSMSDDNWDLHRLWSPPSGKTDEKAEPAGS
jgi:hypothetical protein